MSVGIHPPRRFPYIFTAEPHRLEVLISEGLARLYAFTVTERLAAHRAVVVQNPQSPSKMRMERRGSPDISTILIAALRA